MNMVVMASRSILPRALFFTVLFLALVSPAIADFGGDVGPLETITLPGAPGSRYTEVILQNDGPGAAEIVIESRNFSGEFVVEEGQSLKLVKIMGKKIVISNRSATATVRIHGRWL